MPRLLLLLALAGMLASGPLRADCELLYAPPEIRDRLLAFHYTNELRRARERAYPTVIDAVHKSPPASTTRDRTVPAGPTVRMR